MEYHSGSESFRRFFEKVAARSSAHAQSLVQEDCIFFVYISNSTVEVRPYSASDTSRKERVTLVKLDCTPRIFLMVLQKQEKFPEFVDDFKVKAEWQLHMERGHVTIWVKQSND